MPAANKPYAQKSLRLRVEIMEAYKFETIVQTDGIISIPEISRFANREVEVLIMVKPKNKTHPERSQVIRQFLDTWSGALKGINPDDLKAQCGRRFHFCDPNGNEYAVWSEV
jgi:hypothetical protein